MRFEVQVLVLVTRISRKDILLFFSSSMVNSMSSCRWLMCSRNICSFSLPCGQMTKVLSTYLFHILGRDAAFAIAVLSKSSIKRLAITGERGGTHCCAFYCL